MSITYPHRHNLSASGTCFLEGLVSRPTLSTAPANRAGYLAAVRCGGHASTVKRRAHRSLLAVRCGGQPAHTRACSEARAAGLLLAGAGLTDQRGQLRSGTTATLVGDSLSGHRSRCCSRYCCRCCCRRCCRSGRPSTPSASRSNSSPPSNPHRARRRGPGRRAGCPQLPRR